MGLSSLLAALQRPGPMLVGIVVLALLLLLLSHERAQHSHSLHLAIDAGSSTHAVRSALETEPPVGAAGDLLAPVLTQSRQLHVLSQKGTLAMHLISGPSVAQKVCEMVGILRSFRNVIPDKSQLSGCLRVTL